jgi:predicted dehydrogenase
LEEAELVAVYTACEETAIWAQARGVAHAVGTQVRFSPGIIYAKELMESAYVGRPRFFHMTHFLASAIESRPSHRW